MEESIYESAETRVGLRRTLEGGKPVPRGYTHPVTISDVRIAHILAHLTYEKSDGERQPVIRTDHIYPLAEGMAKAVQKAGPDDEIVAATLGMDRRFGIFSVERVTSFRAFFESDQLVLEFFHIEYHLERRDKVGTIRDYEIPTEHPKGRPSFRIVEGKAQTRRGPRMVVVDWRDRFYAKPVSLSIRGGQARRRTILLEAEDEDIAPIVQPPPQSTDAQLRALDQLDAARRAGLISEGEFRRRRRLVLEGRLEEAGYGPDTP